VLLSAASEPSWEWKMLAGAEVSEATHGVFNLGIRRGAFSAEIHTDTLDLRWNEELGFGRAWVGGRVAAFAAELFIAPWINGSYAPEHGVRATYGELSTGYVHYLPKHFYLGTQLEARRYLFAASGDAVTLSEIPEDTWRLKSSTFLGYWTGPLKGRLSGGIDFLSDGGFGVTPWLQAELLYHPGTWFLTPFVELRSGMLFSGSELASSIIRFRLGGMNPYVVPVAGMSWAESWAQYYMASRAGLEYADDTLGFSIFADHAYYSQELHETSHALGVGTGFWLIWDDWRLDLAAGYAPVAQRAADAKVAPISGWITVGRDWQGF